MTQSRDAHDTADRPRQFGARALRKEDPALLTGRGRYVDDITQPGLLHAAFVRSPFPHAAVRGVDTAAARALAGVHGVFTHADLPEGLRQPLPLIVPNPAITHPWMAYALAREEVCYVGEPVAVVVAESRALAEDAAALVEVEWDPLPGIGSLDAALAPDAPSVHAGAPDNIAARFTVKVGDADPAFAGAAHVFRDSIRQHRGGAFFMECRGAVVRWDAASDELMAWISCQGSHRLKRNFMDVLGLNDHQVRVVAPEVGGGFGPKGSFYPEYSAIAVASRATGRAVKWIEDRRENFLATHQERDQIWDVEVAVATDGRLRGVRGRLAHDGGAYVPWGIVLPWIAATTVPGPYVLPAYRMEVLSVLTNRVPCTPVRGAGRPQAVVVMERLMDRIARELDLDPAEVRERNMIRPEQMPWKVGITFRDGKPVTYDSGDYPACQRAALDAIDYAGFPARRAAAAAEGRFLGIGIGNAVEGTGLGPYESATVRIATNGRILLYTGATPQGQSHRTTLAQIAADQFGVGIEDVEVVTGDTGAVNLGIGSFAARTAVNAGSSTHLAAVAVADKVRRVAAEMMECAPDDLVLRDGAVEVAGVPGMRRTLKEVAVRAIGMPGFSMAGGAEPGLEHTAHFTPEQSTYANGTTVAEVEVDPDTGRVTIRRLVIAHDCGRVINPMVVDGQVVGGVAHGIGNAFLERLLCDAEGQPLTTNFGEYMLPLATDVPRVEIIHLETPSPLNPLGLKGAGEGGTIPTIAALVNAVADALAPFGVHIAEAPITPERIVQLVRATGRPAPWAA